MPAPVPAPTGPSVSEEIPFEGVYARYQRLDAMRQDAQPDARQAGWLDGHRWDDVHADHGQEPYGYDDREYDYGHDDSEYDDPEYDDPEYDHDRFEDEDDRFEDENEDWDEDWDGYAPGRTNRVAAWGFLFAFLFAPVGLILSAVGIGQARRRRERGRGLAVAGLVVSVVVLACAAPFGAAVVAQVADQLADDAEAAAEVVGVAPAAPAPTTVLEACTTMMPVLVAAEQRMTDAAAIEEGVQVVADMRATILWAAAAPEPAFQQHLQALAADLQTLGDGTRTGEIPDGLHATVEEHSFAVGKDCGLAGWTG